MSLWEALCTIADIMAKIGGFFSFWILAGLIVKAWRDASKKQQEEE